MAAPDKKTMWFEWTKIAASRYVVPDDMDEPDDIAEDMANIAEAFADEMLGRYEDTFEPKPAGRTRRAKGEAPDDE